MNSLPHETLNRYRQALESIKDGADIATQEAADTLKEIDHTLPGLVWICPLVDLEEENQTMFPFGAIITPQGLRFLREGVAS